MKYLVTGGAGFIGSHLVEELVNRGEEVVVLDDLSQGNLDNIKPYLDKITFIEGDIRDTDAVNRAMGGVNYVLHQAAKNNVRVSWQEPKLFSEVNITGTINLLEAARKANVKRFIFASSSSMYGNTKVLPVDEDVAFRPLSPYAITKHAGTELLKIYHQTYDLGTIALIYFNVMGPRQSLNSTYAGVIPKFASQMLQGKSPVIFGDGEQSRDFTHVKNVVEANLLACQAKNVSGQHINIANGIGHSVNELVGKMNHILKTNIEPVYVSPKPGEIKVSLADPSKAKRLLGYTGKYSFDEGLKEAVEWYKKVLDVKAKL